MKPTAPFKGGIPGRNVPLQRPQTITPPEQIQKANFATHQNLPELEMPESDNGPAMSGLASQITDDDDIDEMVLERPTPLARPEPISEERAPLSRQIEPARLESDTVVESDEEVTPVEGTEAPFYVHAGVKKGWFRVFVPSKFLPYKFKELSVRPFRVTDLAAIAASHEANNYSMFLDALDQCVDVDIRELTGPDQKFLMYWWRLNSYVKSPFTFHYTSRYGNDAELPIDKTTIKIHTIKLTPQLFKHYRALGLTIPNVRDAEALTEDMNTQTKFLMERAQYIYISPHELDVASAQAEAEDADPPSLGKLKMDKLNKLTENNLELLEDIREFSKLIEHGIEESVEVIDPKYEPTAAADYLEKVVQTIAILTVNAQEESRSGGKSLDLAMMIGLNDRATDAQNEADAIREALATGQVPVARKEVVTLEFRATDFFPEI